MRNILTVQEQKFDFDRAGNDPLCWYRMAQSLHASARILFKKYKEVCIEMNKVKEGIAPIEIFINEQSLLLEGFALEAALKGLFAEQGGTIAKDGKIIIKKSHLLIYWCEQTSIVPDTEEKKILTILSLLITSYGRYPIPDYYLKKSLERTIEKGFTPRYIWQDKYYEIINDFIENKIGISISS